MIYFELFYTFFLIGLFTFGGGYAMIPLIENNVLSKKWMTEVELTNFIGISEITPGPFAINISTFIGTKMGGVLGATCATIGVVLPSFIIILIVAAVLSKLINNKYVKAGLAGVSPVAMALILSTTIILMIKILFFNSKALYSEFVFDIRSLGMLLILGGFMIIYKKVKKKSLNPILLICISALFGIVVFI